jgi:AhpD family alkylhydroperoxidase
VRPASLDRDYGLGPKVLFRMIRLFSGHLVPDAAKIMFYRAEFYGDRMKELTDEAMRGPSAWSIGDRELMAAYVSEQNQCPFCIGAHSATASRAYEDPERVAAALADLDTARIEEPLRATLCLLGKLTREGTLQASDMLVVLSAGVSRQQIEDALAICFVFNTIDRLANAFGFEVLTPEGFEAGAKYLLKRGYR